jgi:hypothetical protein
MPKFSGPEQALLRDWANARLLEDSMKAVRMKYVELAHAVLEKVKRNHPELNYSKVYFSRDGTEGLFAIAKNAWPKNKSGWPCGYYIECIDLDCLLSEDLDSPCKCVCVYGPNASELEKT